MQNVTTNHAITYTNTLATWSFQIHSHSNQPLTHDLQRQTPSWSKNV